MEILQNSNTLTPLLPIVDGFLPPESQDSQFNSSPSLGGNYSVHQSFPFQFQFPQAESKAVLIEGQKHRQIKNLKNASNVSLSHPLLQFYPYFLCLMLSFYKNAFS